MFNWRRVLYIGAFMVVMLPSLAQGAEGFVDPLLLISTGSLETVLNDTSVRVLDARNPKDFQKGHIPNAVNLPASSMVDPESRIEGKLLGDTRLASKFGLAGIGKDTHVVLYDDQGGRLAARLVWVLHYMGHQLVSVLDGGFSKWVKEGRPTTQSVVQVGRRVFPIDQTPRVIASADWILQHMGSPDVVIVDARPADLYAKDHIPGAVNIPWDKSLSADRTWKTSEELSKVFEGAGVTKEKEVVVYSEVGEMSSLSYLVLRALGYPRVRVYDRSWAEWRSDLSLPKTGKTSPPMEIVKGFFRANGCMKCHQTSSKAKEVSFSEAGLNAGKAGSGCTAIMATIVNPSKEESKPAVEEVEAAKKRFKDHGCVKCHSIDGRGETESNLTKLGLEYKGKNLGCIDMMVILRGKP